MAEQKPTEQEPSAATGESPAPKAKKKLSLPKWAIFAVIVLIQAVGSYYIQKTFLFSHNSGIAEAKPKVEEKKTEPEVEMPMVMLDELVVNPAETAGRRYLAITVGLQAAKPESEQIIEKRQALIRDGLISLLSSKYLEQLSSIQYRDSLKREIKDMVNHELGDQFVDKVIFTGYVLQ